MDQQGLSYKFDVISSLHEIPQALGLPAFAPAVTVAA
jgi:hypothetical protein